MTYMKPFDPLHTPLSGNNLIEASAGTGKTYTLEGLFLRLIIEKEIPAEKILVVTFTKAATEELKHRIQGKLARIYQALTRGISEDLFIGAYLKEIKHKSMAAQLVRDAIVDFDRASIFTIHGFCQRILHENAFETGNLFDTELISNQAKLLREISDDFWRKFFYPAQPEFVCYALNHRFKGPEDFLKLLGVHPTAEANIIPRVDQPVLKSLYAYRACYEQTKSDWPQCRQAVVELMLDPVLKRNIYSDNQVMTLMASMNRFVNPKSVGFPLFKGFEKFSARFIAASVKKNCIPPAHAFFDTCDELFELEGLLKQEMAGTLVYFKRHFFDYVRNELLKRKKDLNIQFFDDLLIRVRNALGTPEGHVLAQAVQKKFHAALVDEFQDTDSIQYEIFSSLFDADNRILFVIGDPKQAIYAFRGADVFSYLKASRTMPRHHTLLKNWRSRPGLVKAVNAIFSGADYPFLFSEITFREGKSAETDTDKKLMVSAAPMQLWYFKAESGQPMNKTDAVELISEQVAVEIADLLVREKEQFTEGDIAVLVRTNRQAQVVKSHLSRHHIPSVLYNAGNVFESREASELYRVLASICEPGNESKLRAALSTQFVGITAEKLIEADQNQVWWEEQHARWHDYHDLWIQRGLMPMFRTLLNKEGLRNRLLALPEGERRLTNLLHLIELLHQASIEKGRGIMGLMQWFDAQLEASLPGPETYQLRLETDARAVKIVTIHKSKGLEYPVVFCPFTWEGSDTRNESIVFHHPDTEELTLDINPDPGGLHYRQAQKELLAENIRLLYVALTRARDRCYLAWGNFKTAETSALAYLFHYRRVGKAQFSFAELQQCYRSKQNHELLSDLDKLVRRSDHSIEIVLCPFDGRETYKAQNELTLPPVCRKFSGNIDNSWQMTSYTALISQTGTDVTEELHKHARINDFEPAMGIDSTIASEPQNVFAFPRGARTGILFHDLFEQLDFALKDPEELQTLVDFKLRAYGISPSWQRVICEMLQNVMHTRISEKDSSLVLSKIKPHDRIHEMEFYFPIRSVCPNILHDLLADAGLEEAPEGFSQQTERIMFSPSMGFMKGYIDLVFRHKDRFYILDWKSNYLGPQIECYDRAGIIQNMQKSFYMLQYLLYTLALHRYLQVRLPGYGYKQHFGGIFYLFCRGIQPDKGPDYGIFTDRPNEALIETLAETFVQG